MFKREITKYDNGLLHIHYHVPFLSTVSMAFHVGTGSSTEAIPENLGISHFLEHMIFNGSEKYPDEIETSKLLDSNGVYENAWTWNCETLYYKIAPKSSMEVAFDILYQQVFFPLLLEKSVDKERGIILEELIMYENDPFSSLGETLDYLAFKGSTHSHPVIGTRESLKSMSQERLKDYHSSYYSADNCTFITYGGVELSELKDFGDRLSDIQCFDKQSDINAGQYSYTRDANFPMYRDVDIPIIAFLKHSDPPKDIKHLVSLILLNDLLGAGSGSLLEQELSVKQSLVSSASLGIYINDDYSIMSFGAGAEEKNLEKVRELVGDMLADLPKYIDEEKFERAKGYAYGRLIRSIEDVNFLMLNSLLSIERANILYGWDYSIQDLLDSLEKATITDVLTVWEEFSVVDRTVEGSVLPKKNVEQA